MVQLHLKPELERKLQEELSAGLDANELVEAALNAISERRSVKEAIDAGWQQAEVGRFVESSRNRCPTLEIVGR